jgi:hypothetical protein
VLVEHAQVVVRRSVVRIGSHHLLEALDGGLHLALALVDDAEVIPGDHVVGVGHDGVAEGVLRFVEPAEMEERDREAEVRRCRRRIVLNGPARGAHAFHHGAPPVVAEGELEVRGSEGLVQLDHPLEGALRIAGLPEMVEGEAQIEVRVGVVGIRLDDLETAIPITLGQIARERTVDRHRLQGEPTALAEVVVGGVLDAAFRAGTRVRPGHGPDVSTA